MEQLTGIPPTSILGLSLLDVAILPAARTTTREVLQSVLAGEDMYVKGVELAFQSSDSRDSPSDPDAGVKWVKFSMSFVREAGMVTAISAVGQDITESKRLEQARNAFLASFSHELRTPLSGILGMLELLR